jgi:hypothetical protein
MNTVITAIVIIAMGIVMGTIPGIGAMVIDTMNQDMTTVTDATTVTIAGK